MKKHCLIRIELFKQMYKSFNSKQRSAIREEIRMNYDWGGKEDIYTFFERNCDKNFPMSHEKTMEIVDKLLLGVESLDIRKTRACGMTHLLLLYVTYVFKYINNECIPNKEIWFKTFKMGYCKQLLKQLSWLFDKEGIQYKTKSTTSRGIEITTDKGWKIVFSNSLTKILGGMTSLTKIAPFALIEDEYMENYSTDKEAETEMMKKLKELPCGDKIFKITTYTSPTDEANEETINFRENLKMVNIPWFCNRNFCDGLRFEREIIGIKNTIIVPKENIEEVINNESYIETMLIEGWKITSDWLEEVYYAIRKMKTTTSAENKLGEFFIDTDETTTVFYNSFDLYACVFESIDHVCMVTGITDEDEIKSLVKMYQHCCTDKEITETENNLITLLQKRIQEKEDNKDSLYPYIKLLMDVFSIE